MNITDPPEPDPLFPHRILERVVEPDMHQRIVAIIGDDIGRMHDETVRLAVQARLHAELGIVVVFKQEEPLQPIKNGPDGLVYLSASNTRYEEASLRVRPKPPTIPIPNQRRKWWER